MPESSHQSHTGSLFNLLRHPSSAINHDMAREVEAYYAGNPLTSPVKVLPRTQPQTMALEVEAAASVKPVTVMFVDLRDFTAMVEQYPPNQVVRQLNEYFSCMTRIIVNYGGILDKYMGDEIMAYFECHNPLDYARAAQQAVMASLEMLYALEQLNQQWQQRGWPPLKSGIGINSGPVVKGNIGSMVKLETTIIGDTVNVASRLQHLNKDFNTRLLISAATFKLIQGQFPVRSLGDVSIRGRSKPLGVFEVNLETIMASLVQNSVDSQAYSG